MNEDKQKRGTLSHSPFVTPAGFKPTTSGTGILRSIQLNYEAFVVYCACKSKHFCWFEQMWRNEICSFEPP